MSDIDDARKRLGIWTKEDLPDWLKPHALKVIPSIEEDIDLLEKRLKEN